MQRRQHPGNRGQADAPAPPRPGRAPSPPIAAFFLFVYLHIALLLFFAPMIIDPLVSHSSAVPELGILFLPLFVVLRFSRQAEEAAPGPSHGSTTSLSGAAADPRCRARHAPLLLLVGIHVWLPSRIAGTLHLVQLFHLINLALFDEERRAA